MLEKKTLLILIDKYFKTDINSYNSIGLLGWSKPDERQLKWYFDKYGKTMRKQRTKYFIKKFFIEQSHSNNSIIYNAIYISPIEKTNLFYVINDFQFKNMGDITRYKFRLIDENKYKFISSEIIKIR